ncbi:MAG: hypothetical protein ACK5LN_12595 [Propioniciclava sp.]
MNPDTWGNLDIWGQAALIIGVGVVVVVGGVPLVNRAFGYIERPGGRGVAEQPALVAAGATLRGGAWIGALERLSVYAAILAGFPTGIALVIGLKGLARYPELRAATTGAAERFIIGTFLSLLLACAGAGVALLAIGSWPSPMAR